MREGIANSDLDGFLSGHPFRTRVWAGGRDMSATLGGDWVTSLRFDGENPDRPAGEFGVSFLHSAGGVSAAPGIAGSPLNAGGKLMHPGTAVRVELSLDGGPWKPWLAGEIEDVDWSSDRVEVTCLTLDGALLATQIEVEEQRNVPAEGQDPEAAAKPVEDEIRYLLGRWKPGTTLRVIGSPQWKVGAYKPSGSLGEQIRLLAQQNAWDCRYRWSEAQQAFVLTLYEPPRDKETPDLLLAEWDILAVEGLAESRQWVRNAFAIEYSDVDIEQRVTDTLENPASIAKYGRRWMKIIEDDESPIDSLPRAMRLLEYARHDLSDPLAEGRYRIPFLPWVQLHDIVALKGDDIHYDYDTIVSVVGVSHTIDGEQGASTVITTRGGKPVGMFLEWHRRQKAWTPKDEDDDADPVVSLEFRGVSGGLRQYRVKTAPPADVQVYWAIYEGAAPNDLLEQLVTNTNYRHLLAGGTGSFATPSPAPGQVLCGIVFPIKETADGIDVAGDGVEFFVDGDAEQVTLGDAMFTESPDGRTSVFSIVVNDPGGVVSGVELFFTEAGVETGPRAALKSGNVYSLNFNLHPQHIIHVRGRVTRNDGGEPIHFGPFAADTDKVPAAPHVRLFRVADSVVVAVDADDTDAATLWRREVFGGVPSAEVRIQPRGTEGRFGAFTVVMGTEAERRFQIYAKSAAGVAGDYRDISIEPTKDIDADLQEVRDELDALESYIGGAFADGIVDQAETLAIGEHLRALGAEKSDLDEQYNTINANPALVGSAKTQLTAAKTAYNTSHAALLNAINTAIADGKATPAERADVDAKFAAYGGALSTLSRRLLEAIEAIKQAGLDTIPKYAYALARITASTPTTVSITVTGDPAGAQYELLGTTSAIRVSGPAVGVKSPISTVWVFSRPATGAGPSEAWFRATAPGHVLDDAGVVIPEQQPSGGIVPLTMRASIFSTGATSATVRVHVADPEPGGTIVVSHSGISGTSPSGSQNITSTAADIDSAGFVSFTVPRAAHGSGDKSIQFKATKAGRVAAVDSIIVQEQHPPAVLIETSESSTEGTLTLIPLPGAIIDQVLFLTQTGNLPPETVWRAGTFSGGRYTKSVLLHGKHTSAIGFQVWRGGAIIQQGWIRGFDLGSFSDILDISVTPAGNGIANVHVAFDTDTDRGFNTAQFEVDGAGDWLTVRNDYTAAFQVQQSQTVERTIRVRGRAAGVTPYEWSPWVTTKVPIYKPTETGGGARPTVTGAAHIIHVRGSCAPVRTNSQHKITWSLSNSQSGYFIQIIRMRDGALDYTIASGLSINTTEYIEHSPYKLPLGFDFVGIGLSYQVVVYQSGYSHTAVTNVIPINPEYC